MIALSLLLLVATAQAVLPPSPVNDNDDVINSAGAPVTACESGAINDKAGTLCTPVTQCTAQWYLENVANLETEAPISLEPGKVVGTNSLNIVVQHAAVKGRKVTGIVLKDGANECNYPGPNWTKGTQANWADNDKKAGSKVCRDTYISNIPWATNCGMVRSENASHVTFTGQGTVSYDDPLPPIDGNPVGNRQVSSVIKFALSQPKVIRDITTTVTILDEPRLLGAVTRQQFDLNTGLATLSIALSLAAPLRTDKLLTSTPPSGLAITPVGAADNALCRDAADVACQQRYTFTIDPKDLCKVDGNYTFTFSVACHPSIANTAACPTSMTTAPLAISVQLQGEDICAVVQGVLQVGGTITPHGEFTPATFAFGPLKTAFFQDQTLHFQVTANSINAFPFASSKIILVEAQDKAGVRQKLYDTAAGGAQEGWTFSFASDPANAGTTKTSHKHQFSYIAAPGKFGDVERNKPIDSDVVVAVEVTFVNPIGPGRKRVLTQVVKRQAQNTKTANAQARIQVAAVEGGAPVVTTTGAVGRSTTGNIIETDGAAALVVPSLAFLAAAQLF